MEVGAGLTCKFDEGGVALARVFLTMATGVRLEGWSYGKAEWPLAGDSRSHFKTEAGEVVSESLVCGTTK
jgi:hypothetical protein